MGKLFKLLLGFILFSCSMNHEKLPERYIGQITQEEYEVIIRHSKNFLQEKGTIEKIEDGVIYVELDDEPDDINQLGLDNLLRNCKQEEDKNKWKDIIVDHFTKLTTNLNFDKSNFDKCRGLLAIRIYPEFEEKVKSVMIYKVDFPGTISALVLDLPDKYESIDQETIDLWGVPIDSLFYLAQENVNQRNGIQIKEAKENESKRIYSFFSIDHSASYIRDMEGNADFAIGKFGAFVALPTRGSAFVIPIEDKSAVKAMDKLRPTIKTFFDEDPGNITVDFFWYFNGSFELVKVVDDRIILPEKLTMMI